jgi:hypothetical protein
MAPLTTMRPSSRTAVSGTSSGRLAPRNVSSPVAVTSVSSPAVGASPRPVEPVRMKVALETRSVLVAAPGEHAARVDLPPAS